jgi:hypothetical protein
MKTSLGLRPVHHRGEDRIRGHIQLCWLALLLIRVAENATGDTWPTLRHELDCMALVTLVSLATSHGTVAQRSQTTTDQRLIWRPGPWRTAEVLRLHPHSRLNPSHREPVGTRLDRRLTA